MLAPSTKFKTVDEYIMAFPPEQQTKLEQMRRIVKENAPGAAEVISYNMPGVNLHGVVVWYAAYKGHIGFYPKPAAIVHFSKQLEKYKQSKGAIQFPLNEPLPEKIIAKITQYRLKENIEANKLKVKK